MGRMHRITATAVRYSTFILPHPAILSKAVAVRGMLTEFAQARRAEALKQRHDPIHIGAVVPPDSSGQSERSPRSARKTTAFFCARRPRQRAPPASSASADDVPVLT